MDYAGSTDAGDPEPVELNSMVRETVRLVRGSFSKIPSLEVNLDLHASAPVRANPGQVRQMLLNLMMNAFEALEGKPGTIAVSTSITRVSHGSNGSGPSDPAPGEYVLLEISDTGAGMNEEAKARVFDPFFSSKALGRGLGLASVQGVLRSIGGAVQVMSSPGQGSTFKVWLPSWDSKPESEEGRNGESSLARSNRAQAVLLVDDEDLLRAAVERALQREGFFVITARDGAAAVELFARHCGDIDVVVLDLSLPFLSGREVFEKMRELKKDVQVVFTSGHDSVAIESAQRTTQRALSSKTVPTWGSGPNASGDNAPSARRLKCTACCRSTNAYPSACLLPSRALCRAAHVSKRATPPQKRLRPEKREAQSQTECSALNQRG